MKIAVSGATGYIGFHLIRKLLSDGDTVLAITRKLNEKLIALAYLYTDTLFFCELISDDAFIIIEQFCPEVIYSTTCCYETDMDFLEKTVDANYVFPAYLLKSVVHLNNCQKQSCISGGGRRFINLGTSLPAELNLYSLTKKQFAELGELFANMGKVQFVNILLESFYGSDEPKSRFILSSVLKLFNNHDLNVTLGTQRRDYIAAEDVIDILSYLSKAEGLDKGYNAISVGSGCSPSIREILEYLKEIIKSDSTINFGAVPFRINEPNTKADLTNLRKIGYTKELIYWKDGLRMLVEELKSENFD